jgi:hypothetical protein
MDERHRMRPAFPGKEKKALTTGEAIRVFIRRMVPGARRPSNLSVRGAHGVSSSLSRICIGNPEH